MVLKAGKRAYTNKCDDREWWRDKYKIRRLIS
jgi:hypothetical protein